MSKVDFITFCHWRDWQRLFNYEELQKRVETHRYAFHEVIVVKQRLRDVPESKIAIFSNADRVVESEDYPHVLRDFGLPDEDKIADDYTHGPEAPHYWKWHVINHLIGLTVSQAEYIVFSDADCRMVSNAAPSWIDVGIQLLQQHPEILIVGPSDGGMMAERRIRKPYGVVRLTQNISQQVFLCNRQRLLEGVLVLVDVQGEAAPL